MKLDFIDDFSVDLEQKDSDFDVEMTLRRLSIGLFWLYQEVAKVEQRVKIIARKQNIINCISGPLLDEMPHAWTSCAHHWYSTTLYNYVRLVGWLEYKDKEEVTKYIKRVIPVISSYRHKVAAHFSITDPFHDNEADLHSNLITTIVYAENQLLAGALSEILKDESGIDIKVSHDTSWNLVNTHKSLIPRYWPVGPSKQYHSIKLSEGTTRRFVVNYPKN